MFLPAYSCATEPALLVQSASRLNAGGKRREGIQWAGRAGALVAFHRSTGKERAGLRVNQPIVKKICLDCQRSYPIDE